MARGAWQAAVPGVTELDMTEQLDTHGRLPGEITITSDIQMTPPLSRKRRGTKQPLDESERGE